MTSRVTWLVGGAAAALSIAAAASLPVQQPQQPPPRQESISTSTGPVNESVIASWQSHGAEDGPIALPPSAPLVIPVEPSSKRGRITQPAPADVERPSLLDQDWMLDLLVLWRWPGRAPDITQSGGGNVGAGPVVHRFVVAGGRELRVAFDSRAGTVAVQGAAPRPLGGANVLMLRVDQQDVRVEGMATVDPRYAHLGDPVEAAIARSTDVAAFVGVR